MELISLSILFLKYFFQWCSYAPKSHLCTHTREQDDLPESCILVHGIMTQTVQGKATVGVGYFDTLGGVVERSFSMSEPVVGDLSNPPHPRTFHSQPLIPNTPTHPKKYLRVSTRTFPNQFSKKMLKEIKVCGKMKM